MVASDSRSEAHPAAQKTSESLRSDRLPFSSRAGCTLSESVSLSLGSPVTPALSEAPWIRQLCSENTSSKCRTECALRSPTWLSECANVCTHTACMPAVWNGSKKAMKLTAFRKKPLIGSECISPLAALWAVDTQRVAVKGERTCPPAYILSFMLLPSGHGHICLSWTNVQRAVQSVSFVMFLMEWARMCAVEQVEFGSYLTSHPSVQFGETLSHSRGPTWSEGEKARSCIQYASANMLNKFIVRVLCF